MKTALETVLLPRTRAIEQDVSTMQSQAQGISVKSKEEHAEVEDDLAKMAQLVYDFQVCTARLGRYLLVLTACKFHKSMA